MKLTPTKFYAAFPDGLLLMDGHEFEAAGRTWVVHRKREPYCEYDKSYSVSDKETGFGLTRVMDGLDITNRQHAARYAHDKLESLGPELIEKATKKATETRKTLKKLKVPT